VRPSTGELAPRVADLILLPTKYPVTFLPGRKPHGPVRSCAVLKMNELFEDEEKELCSAILREGATLDSIRSVVERLKQWRLLQKQWLPLPLPRQPARKKSSPLRAAVQRRAPLEIVEYVHGLYPDAIREIGDWDQGLPLHLVNDKTPPDCVRFLIDRYPEALGVRDWNGDLPLYRAIRQGAGREVIEMLVEGRPESIEEFDPDGRREGPRVLPVHVAAATWAFQDLEVMRYLVERSPESVGEWTPPDWGRLKSARGCLPLHLALEYNADPSVIRFLLKQWRGSAQERAGPFLPLHLAMNNIYTTPFEEVARSLLDAYPEALQETDERGSTVFHRACSNELVSLQRLLPLVEYWPDALLAADAAGDLPIHVALQKCLSTQLPLEWKAGLLSKACPQSLRVADSKGQRPLHFAIAANSLPVVRMFEDRSPGLLREVADAQGNTPAHLAAARFQASPELARFIVEAWPESLLAANENGDTPALVAIDQTYSSTEKVKIFVEQCPASLRVATRKGPRPLFVAIARNRVEIARLIVANDPEAARHVDARGKTALHCAASLEGWWSEPDLVRLLADAYPAALQLRDDDGNLPLTLAAANGRMDLDTVFLLLQACPDAIVVGRQQRAKQPRTSPDESESDGLARSAKRPRSGSPFVG
jgi:ankyrin repeat protein